MPNTKIPLACWLFTRISLHFKHYQNTPINNDSCITWRYSGKCPKCLGNSDISTFSNHKIYLREKSRFSKILIDIFKQVQTFSRNFTIVFEWWNLEWYQVKYTTIIFSEFLISAHYGLECIYSNLSIYLASRVNLFKVPFRFIRKIDSKKFDLI